MNRHEGEAAFLRSIIVFDESDERRGLDQRIAHIERNLRCVQRAAWLMALFVLLSTAGVLYGMLLIENFPHGKHRFVFKLTCELGLASLISLLLFSGLLMTYHRKLDHLVRESRRMVRKVLDFHLAKSHRNPWKYRWRATGPYEITPGGKSRADSWGADI